MQRVVGELEGRFRKHKEIYKFGSGFDDYKKREQEDQLMHVCIYFIPP